MASSVYSVSQINKYIKNMFLSDYLLSNLQVKGEISNLKYHSSGHIYFTLKDEKGAIKCVMFSSYRQGLKFVLKEGMQVTVTGSVEVYERDGTYQIYAKSIKEEGVGDLFERFEKLKQKLEEAGMFDASYKRPIPKYVKRLGVITAPTGAAVRDIIDVSKRRNPGIEIILFPAIVQGDEAPASIVAGLEALPEHNVDVIICGRGGGSMEDLWGFNDEAVAEAIFNCPVPVISAVGHETDFTIADFVSDLRAPTPSAAAELAVCDVSAILTELRNKKEILNRDIKSKINNLRQTSAHLAEILSKLNPEARLQKRKETLALLKDRLNRSMDDKLTRYRHRMELMAERMHGLSPLLKLSGGYSYVSGPKGTAVKSINDVSVKDTLNINVTDGIITAEVTGKRSQDG
ncbi:MAG: exodeoxyribonuclease VII large subunit [Lachnospiraceae bacterium]|nr:exodeoxyribonuclease VII large subunit [Lachnospiraceae bacterium]